MKNTSSKKATSPKRFEEDGRFRSWSQIGSTLILIALVLFIAYGGDKSAREYPLEQAPRGQIPPDSLESLARMRTHFRSADKTHGIIFTDDTTVTIKHLPPGTYVFDLRAFNKQGRFSDAVRCTLEIHDATGIKPERDVSCLLSGPAPNPATRSTFVGVSTTTVRRVTLDLFDVTGAKVRRLFSGIGTVDPTPVEIDVSDLPVGVYFVRLNAGPCSKVRKLVVVR